MKGKDGKETKGSGKDHAPAKTKGTKDGKAGGKVHSKGKGGYYTWTVKITANAPGATLVQLVKVSKARGEVSDAALYKVFVGGEGKDTTFSFKDKTCALLPDDDREFPLAVKGDCKGKGKQKGIGNPHAPENDLDAQLNFGNPIELAVGEEHVIERRCNLSIGEAWELKHIFPHKECISISEPNLWLPDSSWVHPNDQPRTFGCLPGKHGKPGKPEPCTNGT